MDHLRRCASTGAVWLGLTAVASMSIAAQKPDTKESPESQRPKLSLKAQPMIAISPARVVLTAELFNSAIETLFHGLDPPTKSQWNGCLDIAAGAILTAGLFAALVGAIVFVGRLGELLRWWD